jgi:uncharacterized protein (DUF1330 family)
MKTNHKLVLAVLISLSIGAAGGSAIRSQQVKAPPAYIISEADTITDLTTLKEYGGKVAATLAPFDGHYHFIVAGGKTEGLDGGAPPQGIVVIAFDSAEQAHAWYNSPAYQAIKPLRLGSVKGRMFIAEGLPNE